MTPPDESPLRRRADYVSLHGWGLIAAILGSLIGVPIWSVLVLGQRDHLWIGALMLVVGIASAVGLWRWLSEPVDPKQEDELIPALREAKLWQERRQRSRRPK